MENYEKEIQELQDKMNNAKEFAEMLPCFKDEILARKLDKTFTGTICKKYKKLYLDWGINRYWFEDSKNITNCDKSIADKYLFKIYINTLNLFDSYEKYGLCELEIPCFFFDRINTTYYIEEQDIEVALDILNAWFIKAEILARIHNMEEERVKLLARLKTIEGNLAIIKQEVLNGN